jgi:dTDP-4-dehydrorhamnose 3,5-epimerase
VRRLPLELPGPVLLEATAFGDERGFFLESYRRTTFAELGVPDELVQHNHSRSRRGIVRGIHYQPGMGKLVRCVRGAILDVAVDIRRGSPAFGRCVAVELSDENHRQLYVPDGFGHAFCVLSELADVVYGCTSYWNPETEGGFRYDDPDVAVPWPGGLELTASAKDAAAPTLAELSERLPFTYDGA